MRLRKFKQPFQGNSEASQSLDSVSKYTLKNVLNQQKTLIQASSEASKPRAGSKALINSASFIR